jgi:hypothetical protein
LSDLARVRLTNFLKVPTYIGGMRKEWHVGA